MFNSIVCSDSRAQLCSLLVDQFDLLLLQVKPDEEVQALKGTCRTARDDSDNDDENEEEGNGNKGATCRD